MTRSTYTPLYENGRRVEIRGMAATSIRNNLYQVSLCETCNVKIAWAKSTKTGRWYVCNTAEYLTPEAGHPRFRAVPYSYHSCEKEAASRKEREESLARAEAEWKASRSIYDTPTDYRLRPEYLALDEDQKKVADQLLG